MSDILQIANIGLIDGRQRLEAISVNAASASLTGYRRHVIAGPTFDAVFAAADVADTGAERPMLQQVDLRAGSVTATGRPLDLTIEGDDSFFALTDGAQTWLTRAGDFRVDPTGMLIGERGLRVVGVQGDLRVPGNDVEVAGDGRVLSDGVVLGAVQLFKPMDRASLQAASGSLLLALAGIQPVDAQATHIRSGALEASNTDAGREMLSLMTLSRQFESLSRIVQSYDELLGRAIQKLGEI